MIKQVSFSGLIIFLNGKCGFYSGSGLLAESGGYVKIKAVKPPWPKR